MAVSTAGSVGSSNIVYLSHISNAITVLTESLRQMCRSSSSSRTPPGFAPKKCHVSPTPMISIRPPPGFAPKQAHKSSVDLIVPVSPANSTSSTCPTCPSSPASAISLTCPSSPASSVNLAVPLSPISLTSSVMRIPDCVRMGFTSDIMKQKHLTLYINTTCTDIGELKSSKMSRYALPGLGRALNAVNRESYIACVHYRAGDTQIGGTGHIMQGLSAFDSTRMEMEEEMGVTAHSTIAPVYYTTSMKHGSRHEYSYFVIQASSVVPFVAPQSTPNNGSHIDSRNKHVCFLVTGTLDELRSLFIQVTIRRNSSDTRGITGIDLINVKSLCNILSHIRSNRGSKPFNWIF